MLISQKTQYALRAVVELAKHQGLGPTKIAHIAQAQAIPLRFLEVILSQLKGSGLVESKRGYYGGYFLVKPADSITVGDIIRFMDKSAGPVKCITCVSETNCPFEGKCSFLPMWTKVQTAIFDIYDTTTINDLVQSER